MEAPLVRDHVLDSFRTLYRSRKNSAVQPSSILPSPKGLIRDVILSVANDQGADVEELSNDLWQLARFQRLDDEQTALVDAAERHREFLGGSAQSWPEFVDFQKLNGAFHSSVEQERTEYRAALAARLGAPSDA
jgi:hypothetical protein